MKQKILAFCTAISFAASAQAQMAHFYIGSGRNEVARSVKTLYDGSSIIAGYIYDLDPNNEIINSDNLLLRVDPAGNILWQKQWGTPNNDLLYEMIITQDTNIVVVGTADRGTVYQNNTAAIYRFDINGNLLFENFVKNFNTNPAGEIFNGVCETTNGDIVAVGSHNSAPAVSDAFISVFQANLTHMYSETLPLSNGQTDAFTNVVADDSNRVYIIGFMYRGAPNTTTYYDQVVLEFDPYSGPIGNVNWMNYYDISYTIGDDSVFTTLNSDWPVKVFLSNYKILISAHDGDGWGFGGGDRHYIFRCDKNGGLNPEVRIVNNGLPNAKFSNSSMIIPVSDDEMYISNVPGGSYYDYNKTGIVAGMDVWASYVSSFSSSTISMSTDFALNDNESVQSLDIYNGGGNLNGYLFMAGNAQGPGMPDNDIYYALVNATLRDSMAQCPVDTITVLDSVYTRPIPYTVPQDSILILEPLTDSFVHVHLNSNLQCGDGNLRNKKGVTAIETSHLQSTGNLSIAPNPCHGQFNVFYAIAAKFEHAEIVVTDIAGRVIARNDINNPTGILEVTLPEHNPAGIVICSLIVNGKVEHAKRIMVYK